MNCHYNGLSIIRELGRHDVPVIAMDCIRSVGTYSCYAKFQRCPNPAEQESKFIEFLYDASKKADGKPVLIPTNDVWAMAISHHKKELQEVASPCVADEPVVELLTNKIAFNQWCEQKGFPVPHIWSVLDHKSVPADSFPLVLKPIARRRSSDRQENINDQKVFDKNRMILVNSKEDLLKKVGELGELGKDFFIQEYIPGLSDTMYTIGVYADRSHDVKGIFTGRKVRGYPADIGDCRLGQSQHIPESLIEMAVRLCKKIGYSGIGEIELKKDGQSGRFKLIEINPRSWSWIGITPSCGVNLPWMAYADLAGLEEPIFTIGTLRTGEIKYIRLVNDLVNCLFRYKRDGYPQWSYNLKGWVASIRSEKLVIAEFTKDDFWPYFLDLINILFEHILRIPKKIVGSIFHH